MPFCIIIANKNQNGKAANIMKNVLLLFLLICSAALNAAELDVSKQASVDEKESLANFRFFEGHNYYLGMKGYEQNWALAAEKLKQTLKYGNLLCKVRALNDLHEIYSEGGNGIAQNLAEGRAYRLQLADIVNQDITRIIAGYAYADLRNDRLSSAIINLKLILKVSKSVTEYAVATLNLATCSKLLHDRQSQELFLKLAVSSGSAQARADALLTLVFLYADELKDKSAGCQVALQLLQETENPRIAKGMRAMLRYMGYKRSSAVADYKPLLTPAQSEIVLTAARKRPREDSATPG